MRMEFRTESPHPSVPRCYSASVMEAKGVTPILNVSDIGSTFAWFEKWGWKKLWDRGTPPTFGAVGSGKETCIFLCQGRREGAAAARTPPRFSRTEMNRATRASGCRSGWTMWTRCTSSASPPEWRSHFRLPICRGMFARCTCAIPMGTCSEWATDSSPRSREPSLPRNFTPPFTLADRRTGRSRRGRKSRNREDHRGYPGAKR